MSRAPFLERLALPFFLGVKVLWSPVSFGVSALVENAQGKVLLARHSYAPGWSLPGGGVDRGEPPADAVLREVREEVGLVSSDPAEFLALYTRKAGWVTNVIALYRIRNARIAFRPNLEIREVAFVDPADLPKGTGGGTARRIAEWFGNAPRDPYW